MKLGAVAATCALAGAGAGIAGSAAAPKAKSSQTRPHLARPGRPPFGPGGPGVHSESVVPNKARDGFITVTSDSGKLKSVSGSELTITDGVGSLTYKDVTVTIPDGATIYRNHQKASLSDLKAGDYIHVAKSSEGTFVMAEDPSFRASEADRAPGHFGPGSPGGPDRPGFGHGDGPPPGPPAP
jgi:hypothetical protein